MNARAATLKDIVDATCHQWGLHVPEKERISIALMAWLNGAGDKSVIVDEIEAGLVNWQTEGLRFVIA